MFTLQVPFEQRVEEVREMFRAKGAVQLSDYVNEVTPIRFLCTQCGKEHSILWPQLVQGKNPNFICLDCSYANRSKSESHTYRELKEIFEERGSRLLVPDGFDLDQVVKTKSKVSYICTYCGKETEIQYSDFKRGRRQNLRCAVCSRIKNGNGIAQKNIVHTSRAATKQKNYEMIKNIVESKGAVLLTSYDEYADKNTQIRFSCSKCGKEYHIRWKKYEEGLNPDLLCRDCRFPDNKKPTTESVRAAFAEKGVTLLNEYKTRRDPLFFNCKQCGRPHYISYTNFEMGRNPNFLCPLCSKGNITTMSPTDIVGTYSENTDRRTKAESRTRTFIKTFYNLPKDVRGEYEAHHIKPYKQFPNLQYSLCNLYPLPVVEHHTNNFNYYHKLEEARNPENWPDAAKLPYHNYDGFKFFDLNKYLVTDYILEELPELTLYEAKKSYAEKGILYIPLYFSELDVYKKSFIIYSLIRNRLAAMIGLDIYSYTGQKFIRYNTRELTIKPVSSDNACVFFDNYHVQGNIKSSIILGLYTSDDKLVSAMSFSKAHSNSWKGENNYELQRFCSVLNSSVPGAASKLFNYFVEHYDPEVVVTFCDIRFSSANPNETVYPKLGFVYDGYSRPNYKYYKDGVYLSRQQCMKSKLKDRLEVFDESLTETENMHRNGYLKLYDCGNFRYVWRKNSV